MAARTLLRAWPALGITAACVFRPPPDWPSVLADVRARYPEVPQVTVDALLAGEGNPGEGDSVEGDPEEGHPAPLLLDVRSPEEFATSHLRGARPAPDEAAALALLERTDPTREIVVYCSVGLRSSALAERLRARGFTRVANLEGGIFAWANAGHPTYRGEEPANEVHPFDERWGALLDPERRAPLAQR